MVVRRSHDSAIPMDTGTQDSNLTSVPPFMSTYGLDNADDELASNWGRDNVSLDEKDDDNDYEQDAEQHLSGADALDRFQGIILGVSLIVTALFMNIN